jgi:hypothetical protein
MPVKWDESAWHAQLRAPQSPVGRYVSTVARQVLIRAQANASVRVRRGTLRRNGIRYHNAFYVGRIEAGRGVNNGPSIKVGNLAPHAIYLELGTVPHEIRGRNGGYLHFRGNRGWVKVRKVNHPGTRGTKVLGDALVSVVGSAAITRRMRAR